MYVYIKWIDKIKNKYLTNLVEARQKIINYFCN